jgi:transcriptional regulator with XRE-family HTH domain
MALPIYAKSLFGLMKFVGWEQREIAERLGVSKTAVSLWATGQRPIAKRHEQVFLDLVMQTLSDEEERYGKNSTHARELAGYLLAWSQEMHIKVGMFQRSLQRQFEILKSPLAKADITAMSKPERRILKAACQMVVYYLDYFESMGRPVRPSTAQKADPTEFFSLLRESYRERDQVEE